MARINSTKPKNEATMIEELLERFPVTEEVESQAGQKDTCAGPMQGECTPKGQFQLELERLINKYSMENASNTPDFILAQFLVHILEVFDITTKNRERWYGRKVF
jgi:hypothetical protein